MNKNSLLTFRLGNAKLDDDTATFSLPAGYSCPGARDCLAKATLNKETGKYSLMHGKEQKFTCFAAGDEAKYPSVRISREHNFDLLRACESSSQMAELILASLPKKATLERVRIHVSGDYFNADYFRAWCLVAAARPELLFYGYTKSLKIWVDNRHLMPANLKLNASKGGRWDHLIREHGLKYAEVVFSVAQAEALGLAIDHDDTLAWKQDKPFALLLHGTQQGGTPQAKALAALIAAGHKGYSKKRVTKQSPMLALVGA